MTATPAKTRKKTKKTTSKKRTPKRARKGIIPLDCDNQLSDHPVYVTENYDQFNIQRANRDLKELTITKLLDQFKDGNNYLKYNPITICGKTGNVISGQHRLEAARRAFCPVYFIISNDELDLKATHAMDIGTHWTLEDWIESHCVAGKREYIKIRKFKKDNPSITLSSAICLLSGKTHLAKEIKELGQFKVTDYNLAEMAYKYLMEFKDLDYSFYISKNFCNSIYKIIKNEGEGVIKHILKTLTTYRTRLYFTTGHNGYLDLFEQIYNRGKSKRVKFKR